MANQKEKRSEKMISEQYKQQILNGAYGITRNGVKAKYIGTYASNDYPYYFIFLNKDDEVYHTAALTDSFEVFKHATNNLDIVGLWKDPEPESNTVTLTLPCPLKEPREGMAFFITCSGQLSIDISQYEENNPNSTYSNIILEEGGYFATKEDAQAWLDAMRNNRR